MITKIKRKIVRSRIWCEKIRPTIVRYKLLSIVGFLGLSTASFFKDVSHREDLARTATTILYLRNKNDFLDKEIDSCLLQHKRLEKTFRETINVFFNDNKTKNN